MNRYRTPLFLTALLGGLLLSFAFAQDVLPGVPTAYVPVATLLISLLSGLLVKPLTAIVKRLGNTTGVTTVAVSAGLSLLVVIGVNLWQAWATRGSVPWPTALFMALVAFLQANGAYLAQVAAAIKGAQVAGVSAGLPQLDPSRLPGFQAQPFLGLPGGVTAVAGSLLANPILEGFIKTLLQNAGLPVGAAQVFEVALKLAPIAPDLFDGNPQLDTEHLAMISRIVLDLKGKYLGGAA
ncbi:hypothetical protein E7T09_04090 [Deinococcus sp. KSM4-11]|uniref:hypothetical protein n=1 Tax=Deinococcus sp. KSM4-11 TaxID=2568654 RepID=UPI0010A3FA5C|nr:hypothetical protein [Deinococcus sp. KSM4-11]THF88394.1 hypothetical protein E7T09_04090 [Deinococcus sp. KSM4-11]